MHRSLDGTAAVSVKRITRAPQEQGSVPRGAYLLALVMGTLAFFAVVSVIFLILTAFPPLPLWLDPFFLLLFAVSYLIVAMLFGFLWPDVSWKWGLWLSLPCVLTVILIHLANTPNETGLLITITASLLVVLLPACTCAFVGKRFAPCDQLVSEMREGFREAIPAAQVITTQAHYASDERLNEIGTSGADDNSNREGAYIPTPMELFELFQQFQSSETGH